MRWSEVLFALTAVSTLGACATAVPAMSGGSTTPRYRTDLGLGGAARVPLGDLQGTPDMSAADDYLDGAEAGGMVPLAYGRYGMGEHWDLGLMVSGTTVRAEARGEKLLSRGIVRSSLVYGLAPYGGWIPENDGSGSGGRVGGEIPFVFAAEVGTAYELWFGARGSAEYVTGMFELQGDEQDTQGLGLRIGPVLGMALGIPRFHVLLELTAAYEHWFIDSEQESFDQGGFVLIPGFGFRLRL